MVFLVPLVKRLEKAMAPHSSTLAWLSAGALRYRAWAQSWSSAALALGFLYSPTLTSIHDHRKNHSLD